MLFAIFLVDESSFLFTCLIDSVHGACVGIEKFDFGKLRCTVVSIRMTRGSLSLINCSLKAVCYTLGLPRSFIFIGSFLI